MKPGIFYLYEYNNSQKLRNAGFLKITRYYRSCTLMLNARGIPVAYSDTIKLCAFYLENDLANSAVLAEITCTNHAFSARLNSAESRFPDGRTLEMIDGFFLPLPNGHLLAAAAPGIAVDTKKLLAVSSDHAAPKKESGDDSDTLIELEAESLDECSTSGTIEPAALNNVSESTKNFSPPEPEYRSQPDSAPEPECRNEQDSSPAQDCRFEQDSSSAQELRHEQNSSPAQDCEHEQDSSPTQEQRHDQDFRSGPDSIPTQEHQHEQDSSPTQEHRHEQDSSPTQECQSEQGTSAEQSPHDGQNPPSERASHSGQGTSQNQDSSAEQTAPTPNVRKIQRSEMSILPRRYWHIANNSFLLHGYHNYHHLLLIEKDGHYWLGVPGIYDPREARAARLFGFPQFTDSYNDALELSDDECNPQENFGYWCCFLK